MIKQVILVVLFGCFLPFVATAQTDDPVLFSVDGTPVQVSEFLYIYSKTNRDKADFSKASLEEYLDLYTKFKLKVKRAKDLQLDTIPALQSELAGYRKQLADSYLLDKEVTEKLIREAYDRSQKDLKISHIMVALPKNPRPADTLTSYRRIMQIKSKLDGGSDFVKVAKSLSEDPSAKTNEGSLGYFSSPFPNGFYDFETAAYGLKKGEYSDPVRTPLGYHIVRLDDERPARGEMEAAHILVRASNPNAKANIDSIYQLLEKGLDFEAAAETYSDDKKTASKGGYVGYFGINKYEKAFEDAAFGLDTNGAYTKPVQTKAGWHIIKRVDRKPMVAYDQAKARLKAKIQKDDRFELAKTAMVERIKSENGFQATSGPVSQFGSTLDKEFMSFRWKAPQQNSEEVIFALGGEKYTMAQFMDYLQRESRSRMQLASTGTVADALSAMYKSYVEDAALKFEEKNLEARYPDFKALMREYEEGILLFEITKQEVWDKASQDTVGLRNFYEKNKKKYQWDERAVVTMYTLNDAAHLSDKISKIIQKSSPEDISKKFNTTDREYVTYEQQTIERGRNPEVDALKWEAGTTSDMKMNRKEKKITFYKIERLLPPSIKALDEARGYVVADYQDFLEKKWLEELKKDYKVQVNKKVFKNLIEK